MHPRHSQHTSVLPTFTEPRNASRIPECHNFEVVRERYGDVMRMLSDDT